MNLLEYINLDQARFIAQTLLVTFGDIEGNMSFPDGLLDCAPLGLIQIDSKNKLLCVMSRPWPSLLGLCWPTIGL